MTTTTTNQQEVSRLIATYAGRVRTATDADKVYKDECAYTYETPESDEHGLFVCLQSFVAVSKPLLPVHFAKSQSHLYLRTRTVRVPRKQAQESTAKSTAAVANADEDTASSSCGEEPEKKKPTKLAIGIEGGFPLTATKSTDTKTDTTMPISYRVYRTNALYVYPEDVELSLGGSAPPAADDRDGDEDDDDDAHLKDAATAAMSAASLGEPVRCAVLSVLAAESQARKEELAAARASAATWDGEQRFVSKHSASLVQLDNGVLVSPDASAWKCARCDITKNLWLNLSDGQILCGRRQLDGSGGNNHAAEHYEHSQRRYPLAVKLGTITAKGADVYSYDEDDMVEDAQLAAHLAHFGICMARMEKSEKTMAELEIDLNQRVGEWDRIQEAGSRLQPLHGAAYTGLRNLGNSCYMNAVMQVLFVAMPAFERRYARHYDAYVRAAPLDPAGDFGLQMAKLGHALLSGKYAPTPAPEAGPHQTPYNGGVKPTSFKSLIGRGHAEFSSKRQQDAHEFFAYLLTLIERSVRTDTVASAAAENPSDAFRFQVEDRIECSVSGQVRYRRRDEFCLAVPCDKQAAVNRPQVAAYAARCAELAAAGLKPAPGDLVRPEIPLVECVRAAMQSESVADFVSSGAGGARVTALKSTRLATYPDFLVVQAKKFEFAPDWSAIKLDVALQVPDELDLSEYRARGLQPNEVEMTEVAPNAGSGDSSAASAASPAAAAFTINESIVGQLMDMGFSLEGSKRAAYHTREFSDTESAVNWAVTHMSDDDFNSPFNVPSTTSSATSPLAAAAAAATKTTATKVYNEESIESIVSFGFTRQQAMRALDATDMNLERAADWILSHADELDSAAAPMDVSSPAAAATTPAAATGIKYKDGTGVYQLVAFISHMGTNANVGHYVAHIRKEGRWVIYNDENVAVSENPPRELAYLYFYKRVDADAE